jgi:rubrerythrin
LNVRWLDAVNKTKGQTMMKNQQLNQLLYEALETEMGGIQVYESAIQCATNDELKQEWQEYLDQTKKHEQIVRGMFEKLGLDPEVETPGRKVVRHIGESLVKAMEMARSSSNAEAAQLGADRPSGGEESRRRSPGAQRGPRAGRRRGG